LFLKVHPVCVCVCVFGMGYWCMVIKVHVCVHVGWYVFTVGRRWFCMVYQRGFSRDFNVNRIPVWFGCGSAWVIVLSAEMSATRQGVNRAIHERHLNNSE
jgi:hypothetical protein